MQTFLIIVGLIGLGVVAWLLNGHISPNVLKANKDGEDSKWATMRQMKRDKSLQVVKFSKLHKVKDGIVAYAKRVGKEIQVVISEPIHTIVIGATGSGKTTTFVKPSIEILARTRTKPSLVITDPKGELYKDHAHTLEEQGYKVQVLDLTEPYKSAKWNPFGAVIDKTKKLKELRVAKIEQRAGKYYFGDKQSLTYLDAKDELKLYQLTLEDDIFEELKDIIYTMCPVESKDPFWENGARDLILAICVAFWEDLRDGIIEPKHFNLFNLYKTITDFAVVKDEDECSTLKQFFESRDKFSKTSALSNTVLGSTDKTLTSFLSTVASYISWLADRGMQTLTSSSEIDFTTFDDAASALFIKIPDAKEGRHKLVSLLIVQMYKALVDKAGENLNKGRAKEEELLRNTYFLLDEFANMPKLNKIDSIITVGRSRKIFMLPIIQDFEQLNNKYGKEVASVVKSNCPTKIYIQTTNLDTAKEFSELVGKTKVKRVSYSQGIDKESLSISLSAESIPLISPTELIALNDVKAGNAGNSVVLLMGKYPLKAKFTPIFEAKDIYGIKESFLADRKASIFNELDYHYDITAREALIADRLSDGVLSDSEAEFEENYIEPDMPPDELLAELRAQLGNPELDHAYKMLEHLNSKLTKLKHKLSKREREQFTNTDIIQQSRLLDKLIEQSTIENNLPLLFDLIEAQAFLKREVLKVV
ncbi:MAG: type IV secretory system conjugative DNA transfer family protein [Firmicutes bacterium]|nr:type IV secretory system conjugative DNA transfer family protein [Bacillota bacterium]